MFTTMPAFNVAVLSVPMGFVQCCKDLNELAESNETQFDQIGKAACSAVLNNLPLPSGETPAQTNCINGVAYLCRSCVQSTPNPEDKEIAVSLNSATILSRTAIGLFVGVYKEALEAKSAAEAAAADGTVAQPNNIRVGELSKLSWKIGIAVQSNCCNELITPYVTCNFGVTGPKGQLVNHPCELSYANFQTLLKTVREVSLEMDSL